MSSTRARGSLLRDRFPDAEEVIAAWPEEAVAQLGGIDPATSIVVLTHDPKLDDAALLLALGSPARFIGAMGSRRAQAKRRERLVAAGVSRRARSSAYPRRSVSISARSAARRPRCRSWPRSSRPATGVTAAGSRRARAGSTRCRLDLRLDPRRRRRNPVRRRAEAAGRARGPSATGSRDRRAMRGAELERIAVVLGAFAEQILSRGRVQCAPNP